MCLYWKIYWTNSSLSDSWILIYPSFLARLARNIKRELNIVIYDIKDDVVNIDSINRLTWLRIMTRVECTTGGVQNIYGRDVVYFVVRRFCSSEYAQVVHGVT